MLPINWLNHCKVSDVNVDILEIFYNAYRTPKYFSLRKYFESWDPKIHGPCNYLQNFYVTALIDKSGTTNNDPLEMYQNSISKNMRSSATGNMDDGIPSS